MGLLEMLLQRKLDERDQWKQEKQQEEALANTMVAKGNLSPAQLEVIRQIGNKWGSQALMNYYGEAYPQAQASEQQALQEQQFKGSILNAMQGGMQQQAVPQQPTSMPLGPPTKGAALNDTVRRMIEEEAVRQGVDPRQALALAHTESGLNPAAMSKKGAMGVMQLMPQTAQGLGVNASDTADNIKGGISYHKQLIGRFGGPGVAAAAYNAGPENVEKYGGIPPFTETQTHVDRFKQHYERLGQPQGGAVQEMMIGSGKVQGDPKLLAALQQADADMRASGLQGIKVSSSYRTNAEQQQLYDRYKSGEGGLAAPPGHSRHEKGLAVDISNYQEAAPFLAKYGLINPA